MGMLSKQFKLYKSSQERTLFFELWQSLAKDADEVSVWNLKVVLGAINGLKIKHL